MVRRDCLSSTIKVKGAGALVGPVIVANALAECVPSVAAGVDGLARMGQRGRD